MHTGEPSKEGGNMDKWQIGVTQIESQPDPCPPHKWGTSGQWLNRCVKCGTAKTS